MKNQFIVGAIETAIFTICMIGIIFALLGLAPAP